MKLDVENCWGYPSLSPRIKEFAKANKALLIVGSSNVLNHKDELKTKRPKIIIEALAGLEYMGLPILGYSKVKLRYVKTELFMNGGAATKIKLNANHRRLPAKMFAQLMAAESKRKFIEALDPKDPNTGIARSMLSPILRASPGDEIPKKVKTDEIDETEEQSVNKKVKSKSKNGTGGKANGNTK